MRTHPPRIASIIRKLHIWHNKQHLQLSHYMQCENFTKSIAIFLILRIIEHGMIYKKKAVPICHIESH